MTRAYSEQYLTDAARRLGAMLETAVLTYELEGDEFLELFIQCGLARQFEAGVPKYIVGMSGHELCLEVIERAFGDLPEVIVEPRSYYSNVYWVGWALAHYQWHSGKSFRRILATVSYEEWLVAYHPLHEADIEKVYDVMDSHFVRDVPLLKAIRRGCGLTQEELAERSGIALSTIRAYERGAKDLRKARADYLLRLAETLHCTMEELME